MNDEAGLDKTAANYVPLTPLSGLRRASHVFADDLAVIYGTHRKTYAEYYDRCTRLAAALAQMGVTPGDVVATVLPNIPAHAEAHFGVPACGAVLNAINTRLDVGTVAYILDHGEARVVLVDTQFIEVVEERGAYLNAMGQVISWGMVLRPRYLTIVPLFHCNGWCHTWMMPMVGGTIVCCRDITAPAIFDAIADEGATHFGGAPIVLNMLVNAPESERRTFDHTVQVFTAGAPPAPATLAKIEPMGFHVTQVYGLTEVYGPATECTWGPHLDHLEGEARAAIKARQGVAMPFMEHITVVDEEMAQIPMNGTAQGEIVMRGNGMMKGYYKNPEATAEAFNGGYFHSGDIAVQHADGYIQIADRAKDIIISGGENISSVEIEGVLMGHPDVLLAAVVAKPDEKWGEVPCAFVELKSGTNPSEADLIAFCRETLAGFKTPKKVVFVELPKTSTGKIQKFELRKQAAEL
ncbi:UNVERIFIED_CONTAM: hypothetical protein GTU68_033284 [Idotea baltica]|nr:hypothetical protein [Idotea baltica]